MMMMMWQKKSRLLVVWRSRCDLSAAAVDGGSDDAQGLDGLPWGLRD
jgi:hypothetical protein